MKVEKALPLFSSKVTEGEQVQRLKEVSDLYERQFLKEMVKAMRATVSEGDLLKTNQAEKIFREQLDEHYVEKWNEQGGIGLSKLIFDQMLDRYGEAMGLGEYIKRRKN